MLPKSSDWAAKRGKQMADCRFHALGGGKSLAYEALPGKSPAVVWLGGLRSDMTGTKAEALAAACAGQARAFLRFDYSGHGRSSGTFSDCVISDWLAESEAMLAAHSEGPVVLCGSSMGGWLALLVALRQPEKVAGLVLLAPATDMTEKLMWEAMDATARMQLERQGFVQEASQYSPDPLIITRRLIEDGRQYGLLNGPIRLSCPVRILQGDADPDVPWSHGLATHQAIQAADCRFILIKDGDHRLSRPGDIALLCDTALGLADRA